MSDENRTTELNRGDERRFELPVAFPFTHLVPQYEERVTQANIATYNARFQFPSGHLARLDGERKEGQTVGKLVLELVEEALEARLLARHPAKTVSYWPTPKPEMVCVDPGPGRTKWVHGGPHQVTMEITEDTLQRICAVRKDFKNTIAKEIGLLIEEALAVRGASAKPAREKGWYWVESAGSSRTFIAEWLGYQWFVAGTFYEPCHMKAVSDRIPEPQRK